MEFEAAQKEDTVHVNGMLWMNNSKPCIFVILKTFFVFSCEVTEGHNEDTRYLSKNKLSIILLAFSLM